jgi:hypothetical protein
MSDKAKRFAEAIKGQMREDEFGGRFQGAVNAGYSKKQAAAIANAGMHDDIGSSSAKGKVHKSKVKKK